MWTPKRIVILSACFVAFFLTYLGYAYTAVGRIDGLPPLPEQFLPGEDEHLELPKTNRNSNLQKKLRLAFGNEAKELKWAIRLDLRSRNMVLAAEQFSVQDGRVCLTPLSIAILGKDKHDGLPPEINTIRGKVAYLKFDRPVTNFSEIASRKITEAELSGQIQIINNRRRVEGDENLRIDIDTGTLYYLEEKHRIWTEGLVRVEDQKSKPAHVIKGKGMEMELLTEAPPLKPGAPRKPTRDTITGVKWVTLQTHVDMKLYVDGKSSLMVSGQKPKAGPAPAKEVKPAKPEQKAELHITTPGHFRYDIMKDHDVARFDVRPVNAVAVAKVPARQPPQVEVKRTNLETKVTDHLVCEHLTLRLVRKDRSKEKQGADAQTEGIEIQTVHALAGKDRHVVLVANAENLQAVGVDFFHDAVKQFTILKGNPVEVNKDDSKIHSRELRIQNVKPTQPAKPGQPEPKPYQHITAQGPGDIHFVDNKEGKKLRAYWDDVLTSTKDGNQDLLVLTGRARFVDEQMDQTLSGDTLKVWLEEVEKKPATPRKDQGSDSRRPRHLEALGHVVARSRDMNVHDTSRLVVWFKDVPGVERVPAPVRDPRVPATPVPGGAGTAEPVVPPPQRPLPEGPQTPGELTARPGAGRGAAGPSLFPGSKGKEPRPFDLSARSVEAWVLRSAEQNTIDQLWCEGKVKVKQEPGKNDEKGTKVMGNTLRMTAKGEGNYDLVVTGDDEDFAEMLTDKIYVVGPEINIDQQTNKAWVIGDGAMKMDSKNNFQGEPLAKPVPLTVHWSKSMLFHGDWAEFHGNIQAVQEKSRLACQRLQVYFDKPIMLKEGNKSDESAKVRNLVCDREVRIEDSIFEGEKLVRYQRLECPGVSMKALELDDIDGKPVQGKEKNNPGNLVNASGLGNIRMWEPTSEDPLGPGADNKGRTRAAKPKSAPEMKMTYVSFLRRMDANSKSHTAIFYGDVKVLHVPCERHDTPIDLDVILANELPEKSLYIWCEWLKVLDTPEPDGKSNKQMEGRGKVYLQGKEFWARGDEVFFNQLKQQVIIRGEASGNATLYQRKRPGEPPSKVEAQEIIYNRATGETKVNGASSIQGQSMPRKK